VTVETSLADATDKMQKAVGHLKEDLASIRTGRAAPALLNRITVEYYGAPVPLNQLASINVPEPRLLQVAPFDKNAMAAIEKAIQSSDLGITPSNDGNVIRLAFPPLTEERRKELVRSVHHRAEEGRVVIFAAGLGVPFFSTDTCAAQRALEIHAEALLKGTMVDGVYTADPHVDPSASRFDQIAYVDVLREGYQVMDATAISLCMENKLPIVVFDYREEGNIRRVVMGEPIGTLVHGGVG